MHWDVPWEKWGGTPMELSMEPHASVLWLHHHIIGGMTRNTLESVEGRLFALGETVGQRISTMLAQGHLIWFEDRLRYTSELSPIDRLVLEVGDGDQVGAYQ